MSESIDKITDLFDKVKRYVALQIQITTLTIGEKAAQLLAKIVSNIVIVFLSLLALIFASFAGAFALGSWLKSYALGFLIMAGFYLLLILIFILLKNKHINNPLVNMFIRIFFNNNSDDK